MKTVLVLSIALATFATACCQTDNDFIESGISKGDTQDHIGAIADFTKAIERDSNYMEAYTNRGIAECSIGQTSLPFSAVQANVAGLKDASEIPDRTQDGSSSVEFQAFEIGRCAS